MPDEAARQAQVAVNLQASLMKNKIVVGLARLMEGGRGRVFRVDQQTIFILSIPPTRACRPCTSFA